jgi:hypothetical protein
MTKFCNYIAQNLKSNCMNPIFFNLSSIYSPKIKIITESLSQHDEKHVVPTPLSGIRVGKR